MKKLAIIASVATALLASPVLAQAVDPHQPFNDGSEASSMSVPPGTVAQAYDPGTAAANLSFGHAVAMQNANTEAERQAAIQRYHDALQERQDAIRARRAQIELIRSTQARHEAAYGEAMKMWHAQVAACQAGDRQACLAPTPDPASFE